MARREEKEQLPLGWTHAEFLICFNFAHLTSNLKIWRP